MIWMRVLLPAAAGIIAGGAVLANVASGREARRARFKTTSARLDPVLQAQGNAAVVAPPVYQAPVYGAPLLIRYQEAGAEPAETIIVPKNIVGPRVYSRGVRPEVINAFCRSQQAMRAFRYDSILWAADVHSGDLIDDLYGYLGGAQPGGAPAPLYSGSDRAV